MGRDGGRLREGVVAREGEHAPRAADAGEVRVLEDVAGAIDTRALAVPHAEDAVVLRLREHRRELRAVDGGGAEVFVDPGNEDDVVLTQQVRIALQCQVEATEGRAGGVEPAPLVRAMLIERQANERLDAGKKDEAFLLAIFRVEREVLPDRHSPPATAVSSVQMRREP